MLIQRPTDGSQINDEAALESPIVRNEAIHSHCCDCKAELQRGMLTFFLSSPPMLCFFKLYLTIFITEEEEITCFYMVTFSTLHNFKVS